MPISYCEPRNTKSQSSNGIVRVPSDDGSRVIGVIKDSTFSKSNWHSTKHLCWKHKAIGVDKVAFIDYVVPFADLIIVHDIDTGREYRASVEDFKQFAIADDLGCGEQLFVPLRYWEVIEPNGPRPVQLNLWENNVVSDRRSQNV